MEVGKAGAGATGVTIAGNVLAAAGAVGATNAAFAEGGNLSALASRSAICHI